MDAGIRLRSDTKAITAVGVTEERVAAFILGTYGSRIQKSDKKEQVFPYLGHELS